MHVLRYADKTRFYVNNLSYNICLPVSLRYAGPDGISGFGFELTLRLKREEDDTCPPTWPAALMQSLARYVFKSGKGSRSNCTFILSYDKARQGERSRWFIYLVVILDKEAKLSFVV